MTTIDLPIFDLTPDASGDVFFEPAETAMTIGNVAFGTLQVLTMQFPTGVNIGAYVKWNVPQGYVGTPLIVIRGALGGTPANTLAFGISATPGVADSELFDVAFDTEDLQNNATWTGYVVDDMHEQLITLTPAAAYTAGDEIFAFFFRDDSVDDTTIDFHLSGLFFRYNDA